MITFTGYYSIYSVSVIPYKSKQKSPCTIVKYFKKRKDTMNSIDRDIIEIGSVSNMTLGMCGTEYESQNREKWQSPDK